MSHYIHNFSRHDFSSDQHAALRQVFGQEVEFGAPKAPFFTSASDLADKVSGQTASLVAPGDLILEAQADGLLADGTTLVFWRADAAARKRGRHASIGIVVFSFTADGIRKESHDMKPTVEVDFRSGEVFEYGAPVGVDQLTD